MKVQLLITMDQAGTVNIEGPIDNKVLCYGLLAMAGDAIREYQEQRKRLVQPVTLGLRPDQG